MRRRISANRSLGIATPAIWASGELLTPEGAVVPLTTYEFQVLSVFVRHAKKALSRSQILDLVSKRDWDPFDRSVDVLMGKLGKKLMEDPRQPKFIRTMRNIGYMFIADVSFEKRTSPNLSSTAGFPARSRQFAGHNG